MRYFHLDSGDPTTGRKLLSVGDTINTADRLANPYYQRVCDIHHEIGTGRRRLREYFLSEDATKESPQALAQGAHNILTAYIHLVREMEFENVRRRHFPALPSRTRCIWLDSSEARARYWHTRTEKQGPLQILEVEVDGVLHRADGAHLSGESASLPELRAAADRYWRGDAHANPEPEFLLEGKMTVVRVVD